MGLCAVFGCCSGGVDCSLEKNEGIYGAFRPSQVVLLSIWFSASSINNYVGSNVKEIFHCI